MGQSGGVLPYGFREGFRSEYLADYIFSAFGPSLGVKRENDYGIDLICNLAILEGTYMKVGSTYGVQVKSEGSEFKFIGKEAIKWLNSLEFPLFLAEISKKESKVKIYSTWNINRFLLSIANINENFYPEELCFQPSEEEILSDPNIEKGIIPLGSPILEFNIMDLGEKDIRLKYQKIFKEWLDIDVENYSLRRAGVSRVFGYIKWETNKSLDDAYRTWIRPYFFSPNHHENAKKILLEAAIVEGLYLKRSFESSGIVEFKNDFNNLRQYINAAKWNLDDWGKDLFSSELK